MRVFMRSVVSINYTHKTVKCGSYSVYANARAHTILV